MTILQAGNYHPGLGARRRFEGLVDAQFHLQAAELLNLCPQALLFIIRHLTAYRHIENQPVLIKLNGLVPIHPGMFENDFIEQDPVNEIPVGSTNQVPLPPL